jgi:AmmeMemoRadiSam system protein B/AmmeMemoRadiSam system protein A
MDSIDCIKPTVAGRFYPNDPAELMSEIKSYLDKADVEPSKSKVLAVLTPHAGYAFSGSVAGYSFKHVQNQEPDTVLFIAIAHKGANGACILKSRTVETPLGIIDVDLELTDLLLTQGEPIHTDISPFIGEHSIEVNLPFVQMVFPEAKIAAIAVTQTDPTLCQSIGKKIAAAIQACSDKQILIMVSSDMSHYPTYEIASRRDQDMLTKLESLDTEQIFNEFERVEKEPELDLHCVMCGSAAMLTAIEACNELGATNAKVITYRNSGDSDFGNHDRVVGYGSFAIYDNTIEVDVEGEENEYLSELDKQELLQIARKSMYFDFCKKEYIPNSTSPNLKRQCGVFVTLKNNGVLRGCLGRFDVGDLTLDQLVAVMAVQSANHDIRFSSVTLEELPDIDIQISVLTPRETVQDIHEIEIGRHGLQIQTKGTLGRRHSGTLLPQVATEQGWDVIQFLEGTCKKAGMHTDAWKDEDVEILKYEGIVFGDTDFTSPPYSVDEE